MGFIDKYNCILCKYNKYNKNGGSCWDYIEKDKLGYPLKECRSLSNIYYENIVKFFPFKQIDYLITERAWRKAAQYTKKLDEKYGDSSLETDEYKFIWGIKSYDDLSNHDVCLHTMNDIDIIYDKTKKEYMLGVETAYVFENYAAKCEYLKDCLRAFTKYMDDNNLDKNKPYELFMSNACTDMTAETIEDLYTNFKIFVDGFCNQNIDINEEIYKG